MRRTHDENGPKVLSAVVYDCKQSEKRNVGRTMKTTGIQLDTEEVSDFYLYITIDDVHNIYNITPLEFENLPKSKIQFLNLKILLNRKISRS